MEMFQTQYMTIEMRKIKLFGKLKKRSRHHSLLGKTMEKP